VTKLADGVYFIRHKDPPDRFLQGNGVVIIGNNSVPENLGDAFELVQIEFKK